MKYSHNVQNETSRSTSREIITVAEHDTAERTRDQYDKSLWYSNEADKQMCSIGLCARGLSLAGRCLGSGLRLGCRRLLACRSSFGRLARRRRLLACWSCLGRRRLCLRGSGLCFRSSGLGGSNFCLILSRLSEHQGQHLFSHPSNRDATAPSSPLSSASLSTLQPQPPSLQYQSCSSSSLPEPWW